MHDHAIAVRILATLTKILWCNVSSEMHGGSVVPQEEWLVRLGLFLHPCKRGAGDFLVNGFHALLGERAGVFNFLFSYTTPAGVRGRVIVVCRPAVQHATWSELGLELWVLRIVRQFWFFFSVQMVKV